MRREAVSVFRERGLRAGVSRSAEPQCLVGNINIERKTDTMKSYILRNSPPVQSQIITIPAGTKPLVLFVGLDVHNDSIAVRLAPSDSTEVRRYGIIGGEHDDVLKLVKKLQAAHPGAALKFCYEAGPRGLCPVPLPALARTGLHPGVSLQGAAQTRRAGQDRPAGCRRTGPPVSGRGVDGHLCARTGG